MVRCSKEALAALVATLMFALGWSGVAQAQAPVAADFQKVTIDDNTQTRWSSTWLLMGASSTSSATDA